MAGITAITAQTILCEIGSDVTRFRNAPAFAFWLGLCPENKISGGKVLYTKRRRVRTREAYNESVVHRCDQEALQRAQFRLRRQAA